MVLEFLKYAYFNMTKGDSMNDILIKCAEKAYLDLCRTIKFNTEDKDTRKSAKRKICEMLVHEYDVLANAVKESDENRMPLTVSIKESAKRSSIRIRKSAN